MSDTLEMKVRRLLLRKGIEFDPSIEQIVDATAYVLGHRTEPSPPAQPSGEPQLSCYKCGKPMQCNGATSTSGNFERWQCECGGITWAEPSARVEEEAAELPAEWPKWMPLQPESVVAGILNEWIRAFTSSPTVDQIRWAAAHIQLYAEAYQQASPVEGEPRQRKEWNDPSRELTEQAKLCLKQGGIRDVVIRHEGQPGEQKFSDVMAAFAANCAPSGERMAELPGKK